MVPRRYQEDTSWADHLCSASRFGVTEPRDFERFPYSHSHARLGTNTSTVKARATESLAALIVTSHSLIRSTESSVVQSGGGRVLVLGFVGIAY